MIRGLALAAIHLAIVLSLTAKYAWDRDRLPRAWARALNYNPNLPVRGRYVSLRPVVMLDGDPGNVWTTRVELTVRDGRLAAEFKPGGDVMLYGQSRQRGAFVTAGPVAAIDKDWTLQSPLAFFIPEHAPDPTSLNRGEELWVELSVPPSGAPRPLRLAVKKPDGSFTQLELR